MNWIDKGAGRRRTAALRYSRGALGALVLALALATASGTARGDDDSAISPGRGAIDGLRLLQRRVGLGSDDLDGKKVAILQSLTVDDSGQSVILEEYGQPEALGEGEQGPRLPEVSRKVIVRMDRDPPIVRELFPRARRYKEHAGDLNRLQKDRDIAERQEIELSKRMSSKEREVFLESRYLRADGRRVVNVESTDGELVLGSPCEHVVVKENGRTIIDAQMARDVPGTRSYFELYKRLGVFSSEILAAIENLEGVPLRAKITVVTALPVEEIDVEVLDLERVKLEPSDFEPPKGYTKIEEIPAELTCAKCGAKIDPKRIGGKYRPEGGAWRYFCSDEHWEAFVDALDTGNPANSER